MDSQRQMPFSSKWSYCKETRDWQSTYCSLSIYNSFWALTRLRILKHSCVTLWGQYERRHGLLSTLTVAQMSVSQAIARTGRLHTSLTPAARVSRVHVTSQQSWTLARHCTRCPDHFLELPDLTIRDQYGPLEIKWIHCLFAINWLAKHQKRWPI